LGEIPGQEGVDEDVGELMQIKRVLLYSTTNMQKGKYLTKIPQMSLIGMPL
jgi:hypothetical protein